MKLHFLLAIGLCALFAPSVRAQNAGLRQEKSTVAGTVLDAVSQRPLKSADVRLRGIPSDSAGAQVSRSTSTSTDASGRFVFEDVPTGRYVILVSHEGYVSNRRDNRTRGELFSVAPGQHVNDMVVRLLPDGAIAGHITNEAGKPLRGVAVQALKSSYPRGRREFHDVARAVSNDAGEYQITDLPPGKYYIRAKPPASLKPKPQSDKSYVPIYYPAANDQARSVTLVLRPGEDLAGIDMNLVPVRTVHIRGQVINARTSLPSKEAEVTLLSDQGETIFFQGQNFSAYGQANFDFEGVPPGFYVLVAQQSTPQEQKTMWGRTAVEAKDADLEHVDIVVGQGVDVSGRIRVEDNTAADHSKDATNMTGILELKEATSLASLTPDIDNAQVKADGTFIFREIPEGSYRINFFPVPPGFYLKSSGTADVLEAGVTVGLGHSPSPIELVLSPGAGEVDGTVQSDKQPVPGASVVLIPDGGQSNAYRQAVTDHMGRFAMRTVPPGDYTLFAWDQIDRGAYFDPEFLGQYGALGKAVHMEESGQVSVQLELISTAETSP
jgi:protocatechuate 3,4-dioxygenase beta subunit